MAVILSKSQVVNLSKESTTAVKQVIMGTSWKGVPNLVSKTAGLVGKLFGQKDTSSVTYSSVDIDSFLFLVDANRNVLDTVSYSKRRDEYGAVFHAGDDRTGNNKYGVNDNEEITIDLNKLPDKVTRVVFAVNVFSSNYTFDQIEGLYTRLVNAEGRTEIVRYNLGQDFKGNVCIVMGEMHRSGNDWLYQAVGYGSNHGSIASLRTEYSRLVSRF